MRWRAVVVASPAVVEYRQLLPHTEAVELEQLLDGLDAGRDVPPDRPHVSVNFVASTDGRATVRGRSRALGDEGDHAMFHGLRERVDAVLAGTETLRVENYGRILPRRERRERRTARGLSPEPLACVLTRSGRLPDIPLLQEPEARVVVFTAAPVTGPEWRAQVEVHTVEDPVILIGQALATLRGTLGVRTLLCEGGPTLFGALLTAGVVDELFLTLAPKLTGGGHGPALTAGPELPEPAELELRWLLERAGALFLRYGLPPGR